MNSKKIIQLRFVFPGTLLATLVLCYLLLPVNILGPSKEIGLVGLVVGAIYAYLTLPLGIIGMTIFSCIGAILGATLGELSLILSVAHSCMFFAYFEYQYGKTEAAI
ncbi:MAG: hypothetical protein ACI8Q1_003161 [Parvicella sp.]|jgi:hypothetical protein